MHIESCLNRYHQISILFTDDWVSQHFTRYHRSQDDYYYYRSFGMWLSFDVVVAVWMLILRWQRWYTVKILDGDCEKAMAHRSIRPENKYVYHDYDYYHAFAYRFHYTFFIIMIIDSYILRKSFGTWETPMIMIAIFVKGKTRLCEHNGIHFFSSRLIQNVNDVDIFVWIGQLLHNVFFSLVEIFRLEWASKVNLLYTYYIYIYNLLSLISCRFLSISANVQRLTRKTSKHYGSNEHRCWEYVCMLWRYLCPFLLLYISPLLSRIFGWISKVARFFFAWILKTSNVT